MIDQHSPVFKNLIESCYSSKFHDDHVDMMLDGMALHQLFQQNEKYSNLMTFKMIRRPQLINLAIASGMSTASLWIMPNFLIQATLKAKVMDIVLDDAQLLRENHHLTNCVQLTNEEVLDACAIRGLSCNYDVSFDVMRTSLSKYLIIMDSVHQLVGKEQLLSSEEGIMFVLHFQPIRDYLSHHQSTSAIT